MPTTTKKPRAARQGPRGVVACNGAPTRVGKAESARDTENDTHAAPGRPPAAGEPRDAVIKVRVTASEKAALERAAGRLGLSEWVRRQLLGEP